MADTQKKLVPSHESEALEDKQKLQMKTFNNNNKFYWKLENN